MYSKYLYSFCNLSGDVLLFRLSFDWIVNFLAHILNFHNLTFIVFFLLNIESFWEIAWLCQSLEVFPKRSPLRVLEFSITLRLLICLELNFNFMVRDKNNFLSSPSTCLVSAAPFVHRLTVFSYTYTHTHTIVYQKL